jgi:hypothetical protein
MAKNSLRVTELDFDQIKVNLKNFMRSQTEFTDYDFEASNMSVLIDLLAYNTHYNAVLANMITNEMFLDTAIKRSSVVSLAKQIGYTPKSSRCARALVNVTLQNVPGNPNYITLDQYTPFDTSIDGNSYTFYSVDSHTTTPVNGAYTFSNVDLFEGRVLEYLFTVTDNSPVAKYVIPNADIDTTTMKVTIQSGTDVYTYVQNNDITDLDSTSQVYFLQENTQGFYELYFGDNIIGRALTVGDIIRVRYLATDGPAANVSTNVAVNWTTNTIAGETESNRSISTTSKPAGGSLAETADQIRFYSVNNYAAQNRAVTKTDYASIITEQLPGAESVNIWGGEENNPPVYGKTFISIKPRVGYVLTDNEKSRIIENILKPRSVMTAQHEFVDPEYTYITFRVNIRFSTARTTLTAAQINQLAYAKIVEFTNTNLEQFNATFYRSQLEEQIMNLDSSILSVNILFDVHKRLPLIPGVRFSGVSSIQLPVKVHPVELVSSYFYFTDSNGIHPAQVRDVPDESPPDYEGTGTLKTFDLDTGEILNNNVGSINYGTGLITLIPDSPLTISAYTGGATQLVVYAGTQESVGDIFPGFNEILILDDNTANTAANIKPGITINVTAVNS